jgi:drug/metabolite transporter (DMT)-like permease
MQSALALTTIVVSGVAYHLAQRASAAASPWPMLSVAYAAALALTLGFAGVTGASSAWRPGRVDCLAGALLGLSAFGIEAGFFYVYRAGWPLASASVIASIVSTAILALVGAAVLGEHLSAARVTGLLLAGLAALLIARG